jgi:hypothetical protein
MFKILPGWNFSRYFSTYVWDIFSEVKSGWGLKLITRFPYFLVNNKWSFTFTPTPWRDA